jgi:putative flippase GtrA
MTRFAAVGLASFALDCLLLWLVQSVSGSLLIAVVAARIVSGAANFTANRLFVFRARAIPWQKAATKYIALAAVLLAANYALLYALTGVGVPIMIAKVATEATLFCISFVVQRLVVFARRHGQPKGTLVPWPGRVSEEFVVDDTTELTTLIA